MNSSERITLYKTYREVGKSLHAKLQDLIDKNGLLECASLLNMLEGDTIMFDEEIDMDRLAEFSIHDYYDQSGMNSVQKYCQSPEYEVSGEIEKNIIDAKLQAKTSFYLVNYVKREECLIGLTDVFDPKNKVEITDIGLSQTIIPQKSYIATRVMKFDHFSSTTGVVYIFNKSKYKKVRNKLLRIYKSLPKLKTNTKMTISFYYVNKQYGMVTDLA